MVVGGVIKSVADMGGNIISILTKNKFLATIFLLLTLFLVGNIVSGIFTSGYSCIWSESAGNQTTLADMSLYSDCLLPFMRGSLDKYSLNSTECSNYATTHSRDQEWNDTCHEIVKYQSRIQSGLEMERVVDSTLNWIFEMAGRWFHELNGSEIVEIWVEPNYCPDLYSCLKSDPDATLELLLTPDCTMSDFPTTQKYENATIEYYPEGKEMAGMFYIDCVSTDQSNWKPRITFFGIDFFDWKLWIFIVILGAVFWGYQKYGSILRR